VQSPPLALTPGLGRLKGKPPARSELEVAAAREANASANCGGGQCSDPRLIGRHHQAGDGAADQDSRLRAARPALLAGHDEPGAERPPTLSTPFLAIETVWRTPFASAFPWVTPLGANWMRQKWIEE